MSWTRRVCTSDWTAPSMRKARPTCVAVFERRPRTGPLGANWRRRLRGHSGSFRLARGDPLSPVLFGVVLDAEAARGIGEEPVAPRRAPVPTAPHADPPVDYGASTGDTKPSGFTATIEASSRLITSSASSRIRNPASAPEAVVPITARSARSAASPTSST